MKTATLSALVVFGMVVALAGAAAGQQVWNIPMHSEPTPPIPARRGANGEQTPPQQYGQTIAQPLTQPPASRYRDPSQPTPAPLTSPYPSRDPYLHPSRDPYLPNHGFEQPDRSVYDYGQRTSSSYGYSRLPSSYGTPPYSGYGTPPCDGAACQPSRSSPSRPEDGVLRMSTSTIWPETLSNAPYDSSQPPAEVQAQPAQIPPPEPIKQDKTGDGDGIASCRRSYQWLFKVDGLVLFRSNGNSYPLLRTPVANDAPPGTYHQTILDTAEIERSEGYGLRANATLISMNGWGAEFGVLGVLGGWDYGETFTGVIELNGPGYQLGSDPNVSPPVPVPLQVTSESNFYSLELNTIHGLSDWGTLRAGIRWINFDESLSVNQLYLAPPNAYYTAAADNDLIGPQVGGDLKLLQWRSCFRINARANLGILYNGTSFASYSNFAGPALTARGDEVALMGELAVEARYRMSEHVAICAGGQFIGLDGVTLATEQITHGDIAKELTSLDAGSLIAYGGSAGLEVFW